VQLARALGARVIGTGRAGDREIALGLGADAFVDLQADRLEDTGQVDVAFDVRSGRLNPIVGAVRPLAETPSAFAPDHRVPGKTIIRVAQGG
jgi:D-arabinose 1-dehydrogenase-like Zn-dependent alcohol dehydrogenase